MGQMPLRRKVAIWVGAVTFAALLLVAVILPRSGSSALDCYLNDEPVGGVVYPMIICD